MHITEQRKQRAMLVGVCCADAEYDAEASIAELFELSKAAGAEVVGETLQRLQSPNNATYIGMGKLQEVKEFCEQQEADLIIFDDELSGAQLRNIEKATGIDVIDRTMLILDIFAQRALSNEGKLQVELAQQKYLLPRLVGMGAKLSRQGGTASGSIGSRGPGETKLESDRRHIRRRIESLERELHAMALRRDRLRRRREKNDIPTIAIVGYTNVGKSTLLNLLTQSEVLVKDQLFATLDPTARELTLADGQTAVIIDTVGLIQRLPHQLVKAFHSTLEVAADADLILCVCDATSEQADIQRDVTTKLLAELGGADIPVITVYNKMDMLSGEYLPKSNDTTVFISAKERIGIDSLISCITKALQDRTRRMTLLFPYNQGSLLDKVRKSGTLLSEEYREDGTLVDAIVDYKLVSSLQEYEVK